MEKKEQVFAEIITIGDEILIGQTVDTNSAWIGKILAEQGIQVRQITSITDEKEHIIEAIKKAEEKADIILLTGGLGPTKDDITKKTLCEYFNCTTQFNDAIFEDVKKHFAKRGIKMPVINNMQAEIPEAAIPLQNEFGTAPGLLFEKGNKTIVSMPGVPYEMKNLMEKHVLPFIQQKYNPKPIIKQTILTHGIGESSLNELILDWENTLDEAQVSIAYLPSPGMVKIRLTYRGIHTNGDTIVQLKIKELQAIIPNYYLGLETELPEAQIGNLLKEKGKTLCTAESCTGGYIGHLITSVAGSSAYFKGGIIAYENAIKQQLLNVADEDLKVYGAVSKQVVEQMAVGALQTTGADYAIATSGVAGPGGGTKEKPVGTVWVAVASNNKIVSEQFLFGNQREVNIRKSALKGLMMLRSLLLENN